MADSRPVYCGPCEYENTTKPASKWCTDCEEGYCDDCLKVHKAAKISRSHHLILIADYLKAEKFSISQICPDHKKKYDFFCPNHESILCVECVQLNHGKCTGLLPLSEASKGSKTSTALSDLEENIDRMLENITRSMQSLQQHQSSITDQEGKIRRTIASMRDQMNKHLDQLQDKALRQLSLQKEKCQEELSILTNNLALKQREIRTLKEQIASVKQYASDMQVFIEICKIVKNVHEEEKVIRPLTINLPQFSITFQESSKLQSLITQMNSFGDIHVTSKPDVKPYVEQKAAQAQYQMSQDVSIDNIRLQLRKNIKLSKQKKSVTGCLILPDKKLMFLDFEKAALSIYNEDGSYDYNIRVLDRVVQATVIDKTRVAVTYRNLPAAGNISIVNTDTKKIEKTLLNCLTQWGWGISHHNGRLYTTDIGIGINIIDLDGTVIRTIPVSLENSDLYMITNSRENICFSDSKNIIHCLDVTGKEIWTYRDGLQGNNYSVKLTSDKSGNIFATAKSSNNLIAISNDGQRTKVLLTNSEGLVKPSAVHYDKDNRRLLVCNHENGHAALYDVLY